MWIFSNQSGQIPSKRGSSLRHECSLSVGSASWRHMWLSERKGVETIPCRASWINQASFWARPLAISAFSSPEGLFKSQVLSVARVSKFGFCLLRESCVIRTYNITHYFVFRNILTSNSIEAWFSIISFKIGFFHIISIFLSYMACS